MKLYRLLEDERVLDSDWMVRDCHSGKVDFLRPYTPEPQEVNKEFVKILEDMVSYYAGNSPDADRYRDRLKSLGIEEPKAEEEMVVNPQLIGALLSKKPKTQESKQELRWISISERMPTKEDACSLERVKCRCSINGQEFEAYYNWNNVPSIPHIKIIAFLPLSSLPPYTKKEEALPDFATFARNELSARYSNPLREDGDVPLEELNSLHGKYSELLRKQNEGKE